MLFFPLLSVALANAGNLLDTCNITLDKGVQVRAGGDYKCLSPVESIDKCISACCSDHSCISFSWNDPWNLSAPYMGCVPGAPCCCLKNIMAPLEPNTWPMKILSGASLPTPPPPCSSVTDCSLNGECNAATGTCDCDAGWKGHYCAVLDLVPVTSLAGTYQHTVADPSKPTNTSSWGGLPVKGDDNLYHLFASQFVQNCTLGGWNPGSEVIRATATTPFGPFTYQETVLGTFHHNPTVRKLTAEQSTTGKEMYVMYMIGADRSPPSGSGSSCGFGNEGDPHHLEGYITMAWSDTLTGPWNKSQHTILTSGVPGRWDAMVTNPAPLFPDENSTTAYLFFRGTNWPLDGYERIGLAKAESWRGPYGRVYENAIFTGRQDDQKTFVEDPHIWKDHKSRGYKGLFHGHFDENGYYGFAENVEGPWTFRDEPAYTNVVAMADGSTSTLVQRERPQVWLDEETGAPTILFTGVAPPGAGFYGYTYTFAQRIAT